jgi:CheY-like chemotaxis protein
MPGMDGLRLLDHVLHEPPVPRAIVVLTNRWDHHEMGERMAQAGVHVVPKPFSPSKLSEMIESLVPTDASAQAPKGAGPQTESSL